MASSKSSGDENVQSSEDNEESEDAEKDQDSFEEIAPKIEAESVYDRNENRNIRKEYQELISLIQTKGQDDKEIFDDSFNRAHSLLQQVKKPREAIFDSTLVSLQASIIKQKTQLVQANLLEFRADDFAAKFEMLLNSSRFGTPQKKPESEIFKKFGKISKRILPTPPPFYPLFNTLEKVNAPTIKKIRQAKQKDDEGSKVVMRAKSIDSIRKDNNGDTTETPKRILSILRMIYSIHKQAVCYFNFVVNPFSFSETIENIFYISILAKEGLVEIFADEDNLPFIEPIDSVEAKDVKLHGTYTQAIISLDENEWKNIIQEFKIERPVITRKKPTCENVDNCGGEGSSKRKR